MSWTKNSPAFDRMMEEARQRDEMSYEEYQEWATMKASDAPKEPKDVRSKVGTSEDVFGMLGRIFNPNK